MLNQVAKIAGWDKHYYEEEYEETKGRYTSVQRHCWHIQTKGEVVTLSKKQLMSPEYKWIAEQAVRDVLGEDEENWIDFFQYLKFAILDNLIENIEDKKRVRPIIKKRYLFNATSEELYTALVKTMGK